MRRLPRIDEHTTEVEAPPDRVWAALLTTMGGSYSSAAAEAYARAVGCEQTHASGEIGSEGSTITGFRVARAEPGRELLLEGRHRFSRYALRFRIEDLGRGRALLRAETRAVFPGLLGGLYRALVIGSGGHVIGVRRMLSSIKGRAEHGRLEA